MVDYQTIGVLIAAASVVIGVVTWVIQNRERNKMNQALLLMDMNNHLRDEKFQDYLVDLRLWEWEDYDEYVEKYIKNPEALAKHNYVISFFEGVGVLVYNKLLNPKQVHDLMATYLFNLFGNQFITFLKDFRVRAHRPEVWKHSEYLYHELMKIYVKEHGHEYAPQPYL
jgi:hypothetical protein